ncbi:MAG: M13 family metallopeptidase [Marinifilaceae bacterium]
MKKHVYIIGLSCMILATACVNKITKKGIKKVNPDFTSNSMDLEVKPGKNFYLYANGNWKKNNPLPEDKSRYGSFDVLREKARTDVKELLADVISNKHKKGTAEQKISDLYNLGMDTERLEKEGISAIRPELDKISAMKTSEDVAKQIAYMHKMTVSTVFGLGAGPDRKDSNKVTAFIGQGGLGLPDREYYLSDNERMVAIRIAYVQHITKMISFCGVNKSEASTRAERILSLETRLAKASMKREDRRDPYKTYNPMSFQDISKLVSNLNFDAYLNTIGLKYRGEFIVSQPDFFREVNKMLQDVELEAWKDYLKWNLMNSSANYLNKAIVKQDFDFYQKTLSGKPIMEARWKTVTSIVSSALGEEVGKLYVEKHFPPRAKERMIKLVTNVKKGLSLRIKQLDWMSKETKIKAQAKLAAMNFKIGYPDKWKDYSKLVIDNKLSFIENMRKVGQFHEKEDLSKIGGPVDKSEWFMTPQTVNAYYSPQMNEMAFPAAILQAPFFYLDADDAVNYGAIGVVIGHEMTHGFDDKGRLYDLKGNLENWWSKEDTEKFKKRSQVLIDRFNNFVVIDDLHANGSLSLGENIADLGGLNISWTAINEVWKKEKPNKKIDNLTASQRFFLSYARVWAQNIREKEQVRLTKDDVHSLGRFRVIGPLPNIQAWYDAFNITEKDEMYVPIEKRASIW